jgi:hypothetical protein
MFKDGIITYTDKYTSSTSNSSGDQMTTDYYENLLQEKLVDIVLYSLCAVHNYDPEIVIPWIKNNTHNNLDTDGIKYVKQSLLYNEGGINTTTIPLVQNLQIDIENGLKNLPANATIVNSTKKGDWNNDNAFNISDITLYRKYIAGEEEQASRRYNISYKDFDNNTKALLNFDSNTDITLTDLINARIALANS